MPITDLTELQSTQSVKIIGADSTGQETFVVGSDSSGNLKTVIGNTTAAPVPISAAALPLPAGAATAANQATELASLASIDAGIPAALGQTAMAASMPVTLASDQSPIIVKDVINTAGQFQALSVTTTAAVAKGGASHLANRKMLTVTPTNGTVYWGTSAAVTILNGQPIFKNQSSTWSFTENVDIWLIAAATTDCRITEAS